jgi:type IV pilus assembly protein PilN
MIRINLLPYRAEADLLLRKTFFVRVGFFAVLGVGAAILANVWLTNEYLIQDAINQELKKVSVDLDQKITEVDLLKTQFDESVKKRQWIAGIQSTRNEPVKIFAELAMLVPPGVVIKELKQNVGVISISGFAEASDSVSAFMREVNDSKGVLRSADLVDMVSGTLDGRPGFDFVVSVKVSSESAASAAASVSSSSAAKAR